MVVASLLGSSSAQQATCIAFRGPVLMDQDRDVNVGTWIRIDPNVVAKIKQWSHRWTRDDIKALLDTMM
jgi:hypothetical protein